MTEAGIVVIASFISPYRSERRMVRDLIGDSFCEVFLDTPLATAEARDPKGLYAKARRGEIVNFTGIDAPYEEPVQPEIRVDTTVTSAEDAAKAIIGWLAGAGIITRH